MPERNWKLKETSLHIKADSEAAIEAGIEAGKKARRKLERYVSRNPNFRNSLDPVTIDKDNIPKIVDTMARASKHVGIGPFSAVAGTISEIVATGGKKTGVDNVLVDNGGDIFIYGDKSYRVGIYAGESEISEKLAFRLEADELPVAVCSSSGSVGHSVSFGEADVVTTVGKDASIADSAATAIANAVKGSDPESAVENGIEKAKKIPRIDGSLISYGSQVGTVGDLPEIISIRSDNPRKSDIFQTKP